MMDIAKAKAVKEILDNIETIRKFRRFYEKNNIRGVTVSITSAKDGGFKTEYVSITNDLRPGEENIQRFVRYILNGCDAEIKDLESQIDRM